VTAKREAYWKTSWEKEMQPWRRRRLQGKGEGEDDEKLKSEKKQKPEMPRGYEPRWDSAG
jgi:hypothetical protein